MDLLCGLYGLWGMVSVGAYPPRLAVLVVEGCPRSVPMSEARLPYRFAELYPSRADEAWM